LLLIVVDRVRRVEMIYIAIEVAVVYLLHGLLCALSSGPDAVIKIAMLGKSKTPFDGPYREGARLSQNAMKKGTA